MVALKQIKEEKSTSTLLIFGSAKRLDTEGYDEFFFMHQSNFSHGSLKLVR